jgi:flavin-dependent dehydrogenase
MQTADAIVVGGGPAGSTCAWKLHTAGLDVLVLDRAAFPRSKLCAGWITPQVLADLQLDEQDYPAGSMTFDELHLHWKWLTVRHESRQHSIRRFEFDDYLLRRSGSRVLQHKVREIRQDNGDYVIDNAYRCKYLVGAGGTRCPVYRGLFHAINPRSSALQTATYEHEFAYDWHDPHCHLWFFDNGLPGYAWYVPKASGHINIGLGGMADQLKQQDGNIQAYWRKLVDKLARTGLVRSAELQATGYSYYLRGNVDVIRSDNACIVGDAIGLATRDMCEGIGPAVRSGLLAADSIVTGADYVLDGVGTLSGGGLVSRLLERRFAGVVVA